MRALDVRQGAIGGSIISVICAAGLSGRSAEPLPTFVGVLAVGLTATGLATALGLAPIATARILRSAGSRGHRRSTSGVPESASPRPPH